jgi:uncharacterized protein DUF3592
VLSPTNSFKGPEEFIPMRTFPPISLYSLIVVFATAALNLVIAGYNYWKHRVQAGWLPVVGHIESSDLRNDQKDSYLLEMLQRDVLVAEIAYSYPVAGNYYAGQSDVLFRDEAQAWDYVDQHQKGETVWVYYDPQKPERSSIEPGTVRYRKYFVTGVALVLLGIVLYSWHVR